MSLRTAASVLLAGQILYIGATQLHTGGRANDHHSIFAAYAGSGSWHAVHLAQFASVAIVIGGLIAAFATVRRRAQRGHWVSRAGVASAAAALGLYGVLQAVDGVALKHAVTTWTGASEAEQTVRFAGAETLRWLEWGTRSYFDITFGAALLLLAAALVRARTTTPALPYLVGGSGVAYLAQGWLVGSGGFSAAHSAAIVIGWVLSLAWMTWLVVTSADTERGLARDDQGLERQRT